MTIPAGGFPISQIAIVVRNIDEALERYHRALGWGPWNVYEHKPPALHDTYLHGKPTEFTMIGAETHVGPIVVELLQPTGPAYIRSGSTPTARASTSHHADDPADWRNRTTSPTSGPRS
jgi:hypothetical protein